jgi:hypothetical protein
MSLYHVKSQEVIINEYVPSRSPQGWNPGQLSDPCTFYLPKLQVGDRLVLSFVCHSV